MLLNFFSLLLICFLIQGCLSQESKKVKVNYFPSSIEQINGYNL